MGRDDELAELRRQAAELSIVDVETMTADHLRHAIAERRRGADPKQAKTVADEQQE